MAKRPCFSDHSPRVYDRFNIDALLESLFAVSDSSLIDASCDGLFESRSTDSDRNDFIQRAFHLGSVFLEAGKRSVRKRSSIHNASVWPLPPGLTIKVFSKLDTPSVCSAAATCSFFQKCAINPLCYANIDLATKVPKFKDAVVTKMIQRAGNALQSIKLGVQPYYSWAICPLTGSCLGSLGASGGAPGSQLRRLHLHNIELMDNIAFSASLSVCPSLVDLEIVSLDVDINQALESVSKHCHLLERFSFETSYPDTNVTLKYSMCKEFVLNCPKITTLALKGCELDDVYACELVKGLHELKYVDFSECYCFHASFVNTLGAKGGGDNLEVMILRDCSNLKNVEIQKFMEALLAGKFKLLRHLDLSNDQGRTGLGYSCSELEYRCYGVSSILINQLLEQRPNFCLVTEHPKPKVSSPVSDGSLSMTTSGSCYSSDDE